MFTHTHITYINVLKFEPNKKFKVLSSPLNVLNCKIEEFYVGYSVFDNQYKMSSLIPHLPNSLQEPNDLLSRI